MVWIRNRCACNRFSFLWWTNNILWLLTLENVEFETPLAFHCISLHWCITFCCFRCVQIESCKNGTGFAKRQMQTRTSPRAISSRKSRNSLSNAYEIVWIEAVGAVLACALFRQVSQLLGNRYHSSRGKNSSTVAAACPFVRLPPPWYLHTRRKKRIARRLKKNRPGMGTCTTRSLHSKSISLFEIFMHFSQKYALVLCCTNGSSTW